MIENWRPLAVSDVISHQQQWMAEDLPSSVSSTFSTSEGKSSSAVAINRLRIAIFSNNRVTIAIAMAPVQLCDAGAIVMPARQRNHTYKNFWLSFDNEYVKFQKFRCEPQPLT